MTEEVEGWVDEEGQVLTVFWWSCVDVIPSDGQVKLPAEH